jgi:hypothetical protein
LHRNWRMAAAVFSRSSPLALVKLYDTLQRECTRTQARRRQATCVNQRIRSGGRGN